MTIRKLQILILALPAIAIFNPFAVRANQKEELPRNEVNGKVVCRADAQQSYS